MRKVIKFAQEVCPKCDVLNQILGAMDKEVDEVVMITDENRDEVKTKYEIMGTPTLIMMDEEGNEVTRTSSIAFGQIEEFFEEVSK